jgi:GT2 family glycosyltransferase
MSGEANKFGLTKSTSPKVAIIVLNWNGWKDTIECLESVFRSNYSDFQIIVVDNGSIDESVARIKKYIKGKGLGFFIYKLSNSAKQAIFNEEYKNKVLDTLAKSESYKPPVLILSGENLGFARGNNVGIEYAIKDGFQHVMLLNNDTVFTPSLLGQMVRFMEGNPDVGVSVPCIYYYWNQDKIWNCGGKLLPFGERKYYTSKRISNRASTFINVSFVTGCALLVRSNIFKKYGLLSEEFFFGEEDYEFSIRMRRNNLKMVCILNTKMYHKVGGSSKMLTKDKLKLTFIHHLNRLVHLKKYYPRNVWLFFRFFAILYIFSMLIVRYKINFKVNMIYIKKLIKYSGTLNKVDKETFDTILREEFI